MSSERKTKKAKKKKMQKEEKLKVSLKERVTDMLELPKEIMLNVPKFTMIGNGDLVIENYKGIIEYEMCRVKINTGAGIVTITGHGLSIKEITSEDIMVSGKISTLGFGNAS